MSAATPYFVLAGEPGRIHVRLHGKNGEKVWTTETYTRRRTALNAVYILTGTCGGSLPDAPLPRTIHDHIWHGGYRAWLPIRDEVARRRSKPGAAA